MCSPALPGHAHAFWVPLPSPHWRGQHCLAAQRLWGNQPHSPSARRGSNQRVYPAAAFTRSLLYIKEPQPRSKRSEVSLAQPELLSKGNVLLPAAPGCGDGVIPTPSRPPPSRRSSCASSSRTSSPGSCVCSAPLLLAKVLPGLLLLSVACTCSWMEGNGSAWHSSGDGHGVGAGEGDGAWPLLEGMRHLDACYHRVSGKIL